MIKSRRDFLRSLGVGTAAGAALRSPLENISGTSLFQPGRLSASDEFIRLNSNENAYGPSPRVASAIRSAIDMVNRYPFMKYEEVTERIASFHGVKPEQVLFACGSTEILRVAACAFLGSGKKLIQGLPTFESVEHYAKAVGSEVVSVPLDRSFAHDLGRMLSHVDASTGLVYLCNPNNPTGSLTPRKDLETFIRKLPPTTRVLIDEAYHHYAGTSSAYASFIDRPVDDRRVVVTRTLSKIYGLAGLRLGYAIAAPAPAHQLSSMRSPMNVNVLALRGGVTALYDREYVSLCVRRNADDRQEFYNQANARMLRVIDSHTNFVMLNTGGPAEAAIDHLRKHNILVAPPIPSMTKYIRVSL